MSVIATKAIRIAIADTDIRVDAKGRYCLNDLHKASGGERKHGPALWMENQQTKDLIAEIAQEVGDTGIPVSVIKGGAKQGTYACKELVYAYAMWISPAFNLRVIRVFDKTMVQTGDWRKLRHSAASSSKVQAAMLQEVRKAVGKATEAHHFMNEHRLINSLLTGEYKGLDRDSLTAYQLDFLAHFEVRNAILIGMGLTYEQRKGALKAESVAWQQARMPSVESELIGAA